jgi:hypothetical protein
LILVSAINGAQAKFSEALTISKTSKGLVYVPVLYSVLDGGKDGVETTVLLLFWESIGSSRYESTPDPKEGAAAFGATMLSVMVNLCSKNSSY